MSNDKSLKHFPLISIIIPCYNCEKYLKRSLNSIINQNYLNLEIILIDDGSTDSSLKEAYSILSRSNRKFKVISQNNLGVSCARNRGIQEANGDYVYFLDADDYVEVNLFSNIRTLLENGLDLIAFGFDRVSDDETVWTYEDTYIYLDKNQPQIGTDVAKKMMNNLVGINIWSCVIRREIIIQNNFSFLEDCFYGEDREFLVRVLTKCKKIIMLNRVLMHYYIRHNSAMGVFSQRRFTSLEAFNSLRQYMLKNNSDEEFIKLIDNLIVREIIFISNSYIRLKKEKNKQIEYRIKQLIKEHRYKIVNFKILNKSDFILKISSLILCINYNIYAFIINLKKFIGFTR